MDKIVEYIAIVEKELKKITFNKTPKELYQPIDYTLNLRGKRIRPALLLLANDLFEGEISNAIHPALAIEMFHNFTLIHDDIMDEAPLRRGKPTVYKKWNRNIAILSGDVMLVEAFQLLNKCEPTHLNKVLSVFNTTAVKVCEGQQFDMNFETTAASINDYLKMIELKTATLLAGSLKIGAILANATEENASHLYEFGRNLGIAFQLMDDILDLYGIPNKLGKRIGGDIILNKKTYLLLKAQELATGNVKKELEFCLNAKTLEDTKKVERVKSIFNELNVKQMAYNEMDLFYNTAISHLDSINAPKEKRQVFENFAIGLMKRDN